jgi:hypothetical protein
MVVATREGYSDCIMETDESPSSKKLPESFSPLEEERERIERILDRLEIAEYRTERAELGSELVRSASRYEDTLERAVWPTVPDTDEGILKELEDDRSALRAVMTTIHEATMHVDARNVHATDPQGFEDTLDEVCVRIRAILPKEDREIVVSDSALSSAQERTDLAEAISHALHNAPERPEPPKTAIGRLVSNANVKLSHNVEDASPPEHPGADTIDG